MRRVSAIVAVLAFSLALAVRARAAAPNHATLIHSYEGTKTCAACHDKQVKDVAASLHYQHAGKPQFLQDWDKDQLAGMLVSF
jgi:cytochrome c551/c552